MTLVENNADLSNHVAELALRCYRAGEFAAEACAEVDRHLAICPTCRAKVRILVEEQRVFERETRARNASDPGPQVFEMRELVAKMLSLVDPETQAVAIHYHVDEMTLEEVAALLGRSVPTVRKRLGEFAAVCGREFSP